MTEFGIKESAAPAPPEVSVVVPVYNGAKHLSATIESVLSQTHRNFELVLCDDCSSDNSITVIERYDDPRIRLLRNNGRLGFAGNWNRCLQEAEGRFVKLLPQDDVLESECLERQAAVLREDRHDNIAFTFCARSIIDSNGRKLFERRFSRSASALVRGPALVKACIRSGTNPIGEPGAVMFRRAAVDKVGMFDDDIPYLIDLDYWLRLLAIGDAWFDSHVFVGFRVSEQSLSVRVGLDQAAEYRRFMRKLISGNKHELSLLDIVSGTIWAELNAIGRVLAYRILLN